jgi:hypothetical protein
MGTTKATTTDARGRPAWLLAMSRTSSGDRWISSATTRIPLPSLAWRRRRLSKTCGQVSRSRAAVAGPVVGAGWGTVVELDAELVEGTVQQARRASGGCRAQTCGNGRVIRRAFATLERRTGHRIFGYRDSR